MLSVIESMGIVIFVICDISVHIADLEKMFAHVCNLWLQVYLGPQLF